jgi:hypothetical protein
MKIVRYFNSENELEKEIKCNNNQECDDTILSIIRSSNGEGTIEIENEDGTIWNPI